MHSFRFLSSWIDGYLFSISHRSIRSSKLFHRSMSSPDASLRLLSIISLLLCSMFILGVFYSHLHIDEVSKLFHLVVADERDYDHEEVLSCLVELLL